MTQVNLIDPASSAAAIKPTFDKVNGALGNLITTHTNVALNVPVDFPAVPLKQAA